MQTTGRSLHEHPIASMQANAVPFYPNGIESAHYYNQTNDQQHQPPNGHQGSNSNGGRGRGHGTLGTKSKRGGKSNNNGGNLNRDYPEVLDLQKLSKNATWVAPPTEQVSSSSALSFKQQMLQIDMIARPDVSFNGAHTLSESSGRFGGTTPSGRSNPLPVPGPQPRASSFMSPFASALNAATVTAIPAESGVAPTSPTLPGNLVVLKRDGSVRIPATSFDVSTAVSNSPSTARIKAGQRHFGKKDKAPPARKIELTDQDVLHLLSTFSSTARTCLLSPIEALRAAHNSAQEDIEIKRTAISFDLTQAGHWEQKSEERTVEWQRNAVDCLISALKPKYIDKKDALLAKAAECMKMATAASKKAAELYTIVDSCRATIAELDRESANASRKLSDEMHAEIISVFASPVKHEEEMKEGDEHLDEDQTKLERAIKTSNRNDSTMDVRVEEATGPFTKCDQKAENKQPGGGILAAKNVAGAGHKVNKSQQVLPPGTPDGQQRHLASRKKKYSKKKKGSPDSKGSPTRSKSNSGDKEREDKNKEKMSMA